MMGQLKNDELAVLNIKNQLETAKLNLALLMNIPYSSDMVLERLGSEDLFRQPTETAEMVYQQAMDKMAIVKATELRKKSAESAVRSIKGELFPALFLNGSMNSNYSSAASTDVLLNSTDIPTSDYVIVNGSQIPVIAKRNNFSTEKIPYNNQIKNNVFSNISLGLRVPILNNFQTRNRIRLAKIDLRNFELIEESTRIQLRQQVDHAHLNMMNAWNRYKLLLDQVASYSESFRAAEVRFNAGLGTVVDYIIAKNNLDRANGNLIIARYDYLLRKRVLQYYSGSTN
jgi:outer membrane protein